MPCKRIYFSFTHIAQLLHYSTYKVTQLLWLFCRNSFRRLLLWQKADSDAEYIRGCVLIQTGQDEEDENRQMWIIQREKNKQQLDAWISDWRKWRCWIELEYRVTNSRCLCLHGKVNMLMLMLMLMLILVKTFMLNRRGWVLGDVSGSRVCKTLCVSSFMVSGGRGELPQHHLRRLLHSPDSISIFINAHPLESSSSLFKNTWFMASRTALQCIWDHPRRRRTRRTQPISGKIKQIGRTG